MLRTNEKCSKRKTLIRFIWCVCFAGLTCEGIYRISGVKSKVQSLKDSYNKGINVYLNEHEPSVVASLLKQFLRELPEPVLTAKLMPKFEQASSMCQLWAIVCYFRCMERLVF